MLFSLLPTTIPTFSTRPVLLAHNIEVAGDIAVTFHIEPNHNPKAGEASLAWFALTRAGGQIVPLSQCQCQLAVYAEPRQPGAKPLLQPALTAVNAEQYQGIPGASLTFPKAGRYALELSGQPKSADAFKPFTLSYEVTVVGGNPKPTPSASAVSPVAQPAPPASGFPTVPVIGLGLAITLGGLAGWLVWQRRKP